jgi:HEAT repeat protein/energy-coupling factor transporter ATP-binding protein EcfA2
LNTFKITIGRKFVERDEDDEIVDRYWPVVAQYIEPYSSPQCDTELRFNPKKVKELLSPKLYGIALGQALFQSRQMADLFSNARGSSPKGLRILLSVEDKDLQTLRWERLCVSTDARWNAENPDQWQFLALDQTMPFSWFVSTGKPSKWIGQIQQKDLSVLLLVASPNDPNGLYGLAPFNVQETIQSIQQALGNNIRCDVLSHEIEGIQNRIGSPTLKALSQELSRYTVLHLVCHGQLLESGKTLLYLANENNEAQPIISDDLTAKLNPLSQLPYLIFLSSCETAQRSDETGLGGLAQQLVADLAISNVIGMTKPIAIRAAAELSEQFYQRFRQHGEVDLALAQAKIGLDDEHSGESIVIPALFSCLHEVRQPLFVDVGVQSNAPSPKQQREAVRQFLEQVHQEFSTTRVFHKRDLEIYLQAQYVPIQVTTEPRKRQVETLEGYKETEEELKRAYALKGGEAEAEAEAEETLKRQQKDWEEARSAHQRLMVLADPGMGKSTLLRMEAGRLAQEALKRLQSDQSDEAVLAALELPLFLRLSALANRPENEEQLIDRISALVKLTPACSEEIAPILLPWVKAKLKAGQGVLLLDALDEVPRPQNQEESKRLILKEKLKGFVAQYPCRIICTSRIVGYDSGFLGDLAEGKVAEVEIVPFGDQQIEEYVEGWFKNAAGHLADKSASAAELLRELRSKPQVRGLTQNPLLLSLICSLYQEQGITLPARRAQVYKQAVSQMLTTWSKNRQDQTPGRILAKQRCLEILAYRFSCRGQEVFTFDQLFDEVERYLTGGNVTTVFRDTISDVLIAELSEQDGILQKLSAQEDDYIFLHRTFQEYLTAAYLARAENGVELAMEHCWDYDWHETLSLVPAVMQMEGKPPQALIQAILNQPEGDDIFNTQLLLTARCVSDCDQPEGLLPESQIHQLVKFWQTYPNAQFITAVVVRLGQSDARLVKQLSTLLTHEDSSVQSSAAEVLGRIGGKATVAALIESLNNKDSEVRGRAAEALGKIGSTVAVPALITHLDDHHSVRERAAEALGKIGSTVAVPALAACLNDELFEVRQSAVEALSRIGTVDAVKALIIAINHQDEVVQRITAKALGGIDNAEAIKALIVALNGHDDYTVRTIAAEGLGRRDHAEAIKALITALSDGYDIRNAALHTLMRVNCAEEAVEGLVPLLTHEDPNTRHSAICALGEIGSAAAAALIPVLNHENYRFRLLAAKGLGRINHIEAVEVLVEVLSVASGKGVGFGDYLPVVEALGQINSPEAVDTLIKVLESKLITVLNDKNFKSGRYIQNRRNAAEALGKLKTADAIAALTAALNDRDNEVRRIAALQLEEAGSAEVVKALIKALDHEASKVRDYATILLGKIGYVEATPFLITALNDKDDNIRTSAARALEKMKTADATEALLVALNSENTLWVRVKIAEVLGRMGRAEAVETLTTMLNDSNSWTRKSVARALGGINSAEAVKALTTALNDEDRDVRTASIEALGKINRAEAVAVLTRVLEIETEDRNVRCRAAEGLGRIGGAEAVTALTQALEDEDSSVRYSAGNGIVSIGGVEAIAALTRVLEIEAEDGDIFYNDVSHRAVAALVSIGGVEAIAALTRVLEKNWSYVVSALEEIGSADVLVSVAQAPTSMSTILTSSYCCAS